MSKSTGSAVVDPEAARPVAEQREEAPAKVVHPAREDRRRAGKAARHRTPLEAHAEFVTDGRADPVDLLESQATSRVPELVPIRYGRMLASPFGFYRGAALVMAADLARIPSSGLQVQLCGDAHMSNFGIFASPERRLVFDVNDFDETHPGPFEWDVKRLAASLAVAGRDNGFSHKQRHKIVRAAAAGYREAMTTFAGQGNLAVWYTHFDMDQVLQQIGEQLDVARKARMRAVLDKARSRDSVQALAKLTTQVGGRARIVSQPPLIVPIEELFPEHLVAEIDDRMAALIRAYRRTLQLDRRHLLEQFELVQVARKVVGVGSVGTRAWILLFEGIDSGDPLFLQAKEAQPSVLSGFVKARGFANQGERVVSGQRLMQASSDIFLGWERALAPDGVQRDFYLRQLRDGKGSVVVEEMVPDGMAFYARLCGQTLARGHARSGDRVAIAAYLGSSNRFDQAIADFAELYAEQNDLDHAALAEAAATGRVTAQSGL
ncbi:MAG TPA: DUF2252 domain-containing protein [Kineosporiaceae bacterium]|nr:DUF2252 domain-containing protein [Kineosporiaceae bacterium]